MEYASTVWSPPTLPLIYRKWKLSKEELHGVYRDYNCMSSVTTMLKNLNWRSLDQRHVDSRLITLYKVTYDLVAIPYPSTLPVILGYQDSYIHFHTDRFPLLKKNTGSHISKTIIHWNSLPAKIPVLPTLAQFSGAVCQVR